MHSTSTEQLFRPAAINARRVKWLGDITLIRPISFSFLTLFALALASIVLTFLIFGTYTKRSTVSGQLHPDLGLVKVYGPQSGIVLQKYVHEGKRVKQGEVLYVLSSERQSSTQGDTQAAISRQVEIRQQSLRDEMRQTQRLQQDERVALVKKITGLQSELLKINDQLDGQKSRVQLSKEAVTRSQELFAKHYISKEQMQQKQADLLDQHNRLQALERDHISIGRELSSQQADLASLPLRQQNQLAQIDRMLTGVGQELTESEARRRLIITAPEAGIVTGVIAELGQAVDTSKPLVSVIPRGATLQAQLYAPSKAVGFIKPGDAVLLRYQAYPYQKFGHAKGTVASVSKTALPGSELTGVSNSSDSNTEPLYRITVNLTQQVVSAYGKPQSLQAGMLLDADVLQETRHLYEWVLEPLYSLTGKL